MNDIIPENIPQLQCVRCKEWKPLTPENFFRNKNYPTGFSNLCKVCLKRVPIPGTEISRAANRGPRGQYTKYDVIPDSRICSGCKIEKTLDQFSPQKKNKYGVRAKCKECRKTENQEFYARRYGLTHEILSNPVNGGKVCRLCKIEKPHSQFSPDKRASDGVNSQCRVCMRNVQSPHVARNRATSRRNWEKSSAKYRETNKEWRKKNPDKIKELNRRRDARKREAQTEPVSYKHIRERDGMWCYICQQEIYPDQRIAYDHVIPLAPRKDATHEPGPHSENNIKIAHYLCNARKGNKLLENLTDHDRRGIPHIASSIKETRN